MTSRTKYKWLLFLLAILLISNIVLMRALFVLKKQQSQPSRRASISAQLIKDLSLTKTQEQQFMQLRDNYLSEMRPLWEGLRLSRENLYTKLSDTTVADSTILRLTLAVAEKDRKAEETMYRHFVQLRKICTREQQTRFDTLVPKMLSRIGTRQGRNNPARGPSSK